MIDILKKIIDFLKSTYQVSDSNTNMNSIKVTQNKNSGNITNNISTKPTAEKNKEEEDYTINFDKPQV